MFTSSKIEVFVWVVEIFIFDVMLLPFISMLIVLSLPHQTRSKRFLEIQQLREHNKEYDMKTTIYLVKETTKTKFVEIVDAHFCLNIDPKYNDQQLRATVSLLLLA